MIGKTYLKLFMKSESGNQMLVTYTSKQLASPSVCRRSFSGGKLATKRGEEFHFDAILLVFVRINGIIIRNCIGNGCGIGVLPLKAHSLPLIYDCLAEYLDLSSKVS